MKKLALVLGSLLVVGSVASAKEAMPTPVAEPEVRIVEKPVEVIVYRDRMVEAPKKWRPTGSVEVMTKTVGEIESTKSTDKDRTWEGSDLKTRLQVKAGVNLTENQNLEFRLRDWNGLTHRNHQGTDIDEYYLQHTYNFQKLGKVGVALESRFTKKSSEGLFDYKDEAESLTIKSKNDKSIRERLYFDFSEYLFQNNYFKVTSAVLAPEFKYSWGTFDVKAEDFTTRQKIEEKFSNHYENYGLYADFTADIIGGFKFEAEFDDLYSHTAYRVPGEKRLRANTGSVELTLNRPVSLYAAGKHKLVFEPKMVYATSWAWNKKTVEEGMGGTLRDNGKKERWGSYTAKFEPVFKYVYKPTEYVDVMANVGGEYVNRNEARHSASHWRWQPYAELGVKVNF